MILVNERKGKAIMSHICSLNYYIVFNGCEIMALRMFWLPTFFFFFFADSDCQEFEENVLKKS